MSEKLPEFDLVNDALQRISPDFDPAELHGQLCGMLCTVSDVDLDTWLQPNLEESNDPSLWSRDSIELLQSLIRVTASQFSEGEMGLELLLPSDEAGVAARLEALGRWCQGFLLGISFGGVDDIESLPGELSELVGDLVNISQIDKYDLDDEEEEDEASYMELMEFVRLGVQLFYEEMHAGGKGEEDAPRILH